MGTTIHMGKKSKKIKSDRINALRKQYDSFLEEDKKRKERNEYILGKLDKMAYSTALVPSRTENMTVINRTSAMYHIVPYQPEASLGVSRSTYMENELSRKNPLQKNDDMCLIQEISKNYILIPKHRTPFINNYLQKTTSICSTDTPDEIKRTINTLKTSSLQKPISDDNTDWKSKYEILNILKKEDTKKQSVYFDLQSSPEPLSHIVLNKTNEKVVISRDNIITDGAYSKTDYVNLNELPEQDISDEKVRGTSVITPESILIVDPHNINIDIVDNIDTKLQKTNLEPEHTEATDNNNDVIQAEYSYPQKPSESAENYINHTAYDYSDHIQPTLESEQVHYAEHFVPIYDTNATTEQNIYDQGIQNEYLEREDGLPYKTEIPTEQYKLENSENQVYVEDQDAESVQVINSNDLHEEIYDNPAVLDSGIRDSKFQMKSSTDANSEQTTEQVNTDLVEQQTFPEAVAEFPEGERDDEESADMVGIQAFDAEQREMFYSEHPVEGYGYQQDVNINDQQYQKNETYQQNLNYYESPLNQQVFPVGNDDDDQEEELKLRYDQSYHQQYVESYEKAYDQQQLEYENPEYYQQIEPEQMESLYDPQPYANSEQIQSALDNEEGYIEPIPGVIIQAEDIKKPNAKQLNPESMS